MRERPTTPEERGLLGRTLSAEQAVALGTAAVGPIGGAVMVGVGLQLQEHGAVALGLVIGVATWFALTAVTRRARGRAAPTAGRARSVEGAASKRFGVGPSGRWEYSVTVGDERVTVPTLWLSYLVDEAHHSLWVVDTTTYPVAVAVEAGPSAEADRALGADRVLDVGRRPGACVLVAVGLTAAIGAAVFALMDGGFSPAVPWTLAALSVPAFAAVGLDVRRRGRVHRAYFEAGARFALSPGARRRYRLRRTAVHGAAGAAAGLAAVVLGVHQGADPVGFVALMTVGGAAVAPLPIDEPPGDPGNAGAA